MSDETIKLELSIDAVKTLAGVDVPGAWGAVEEIAKAAAAALAEHDKAQDPHRLPWRHEIADSVGGERTLFGAGDGYIGRVYVEHATFIVTACNAHHQLVDACRDALEVSLSLEPTPRHAALSLQLSEALKAAGADDA